MSLRALLLCLVLTSTAGSAAAQRSPDGEYLDGQASKVGVVLAHGRGNGPDGNVVGPLRRAIHRELGFHTLSLRLPDPGADTPEAPELAAAFPDAYQRIQAAIDYLKTAKGVERIYLLGHSMGGRMTSGFLAERPDAGVAGFIGVGLTAGGKEPVNTNLNLRKVRVPVLDVWGNNETDARAASFRKALVSDRFKQVEIPGAPHSYRGHEQAVEAAVVGWLRQQEQR